MTTVPNPELAPWQSRQGQMYLTDLEILERLDENCALTPRMIARGRRRENVIRLQLQHLEKAGLVRFVGLDTYRISRSGERHIRGEERLPETDGYLHLDEVVNLPEQRITRFDTIEPIHVKLVNRDDFFQDPDQDYGFLGDDPQLTADRILNVRGSRIARIMREFPRTDPLVSQCAHWMRAMVGLHLFPDANHRTAMSLLYPILKENDLAPENWPGFPGKPVLQSKLLRKLQASVTFDNLWLKDELFIHWRHNFTRRFFGETARSSPETDTLKEALSHVRNLNRPV